MRWKSVCNFVLIKKIIIQVIEDNTNHIILETDVYNFFNARKSPENYEIVTEVI